LIIVRLNGGLGNQLFQYSAAYALALKKNDRFKIDISGYQSSLPDKQTYRDFDLSDFLISAEIANSDEVAKVKNPLGIISKIHRVIEKKIFKTYYIDWHPEILSKTGNVYLDGYFQSEKYFLDYVDDILQEFILKPELSRQIDYYISDIISKQYSVSLHIRRGDYVENPRTRSYHFVCDTAYFERAIEVMKSKFPLIHLYIFSDDPDWVRNHLPLSVPATLISNGKGAANTLRPAQELVLMSCCHHHILSNSSFSWWGAYLNRHPEKVVLAPNIWNKGLIPQPNILPEEWISFPVESDE
jgi:hypothetical protein